MGEPTRIVVGGLPAIPGNTIAQRREHLAREMDEIRRSLMQEPRGHADMFGAVLTQPTHPEADLGVIFMDTGGYLTMCVHGSIGVVTAALEMGFLPFTGDETVVTLDTPAGLVRTVAHRLRGQVAAVTVSNVPSFLASRDLVVDVPGVGHVKVDVAFGGSFFALVDEQALGVNLVPEDLTRVVERALALRNAVNDRQLFQHPAESHIQGVALTEIAGTARAGSADLRTVVVFGSGQVDRSPCGTGLCAKMASLHFRGLLPIGKEVVAESILGTQFSGRLVAATQVGTMPAVVPEVTGSAYVTGYHHFVIDTKDPLAHGFLLQ